MSVQTGGISSPYDDLEAQHISGVIDVEQTDTFSDVEVDGLETWEPDGGLSRDELAELVTLVGQFRCFPESGTAGLLNHAVFRYEVSTDSEMRTGVDDFTIHTTDLEGSGARHRSIGSLVDFDVLLHGEVSGSQGLADATNGLAAAQEETSALHEIPYRAFYGGGPVFDRHSEMNLHVEMDESNAFQGKFTYRISCFWEVTTQ